MSDGERMANKGKRWTYDDYLLLNLMVHKKIGIPQIASVMGRSEMVIWMKINTNMLIRNYRRYADDNKYLSKYLSFQPKGRKPRKP